MEKYNRSRIMTRAWKNYRNYNEKGFAWCLRQSWKVEKNNTMKISPIVINNILNNLRVVSVKATQEHFKILNSKKGRAIMKLDDSNETKQMVAEGQLIFRDILHQRRAESRKIIEKSVPIKKERYHFKNVNLELTEKINIQEYISCHKL